VEVAASIHMVECSHSASGLADTSVVAQCSMVDPALFQFYSDLCSPLTALCSRLVSVWRRRLVVRRQLRLRFSEDAQSRGRSRVSRISSWPEILDEMHIRAASHAITAVNLILGMIPITGGSDILHFRILGFVKIERER